ncbi:PIN domain-like protein [Mycena sanguinolenta]|nr:PIN domain-like protein [Mycena sanguinolenta]KAJ6482441.1 PIN domain-like protein [Mycena sanguinolenta]
MGLTGFWKRIEDAAEQHNLLDFTVKEAQLPNGQFQPIIIGIDASIWMYQAERALNYGNTQAGPNAQLRILYYRLVHLLQLPVRIVFAFDGPERAEFKRGTRVLTHGHPLTAPFQELIAHFGYHSHTAPGEADAELGRLAFENLIDIVQTTDSDIFLFGAPRVIYTPKQKIDGKNVTVYTAENIFITPKVSLTRGGILLIALLSGGDYDKGIPGCGIAIAHAIAQGNLGDMLLDKALESPTPTAAFLEFLVTWREAISLEFSTNASGLLGRRYKAIATAIAETPSFPDIEVIFAYVHPITSWTHYSLPPYYAWGPAKPNLTAIARFCQHRFAWDAVTLANKFSKSLFFGIANQSFLKPYNLHTLVEAHINAGRGLDDDFHCSDDDFPRSAMLQVLKTKSVNNQTLKQVEMSTNALSLRVKAGISDSSAFSPPALMVRWIPAPIIDFAFPDLVLRTSVKRKATTSRSKVSRRSRSNPHTGAPTAGPSQIPDNIIDLTNA